MDKIILEPIRSISGDIWLPGSKSLSNRALLLASLASGNTRLTNLLRSDDTTHMVNALRQLGMNIQLDDDWGQCEIEGNGGLFSTPEDNRFFLGNAGTAIRPLTAILSMVPGEFEIDGDKYMRDRPIEHLVDALNQLGAEVQYSMRQGYPPLSVSGGSITGGHAKIPGNISSQFLTALLNNFAQRAQSQHAERIADFS